MPGSPADGNSAGAGDLDRRGFGGSRRFRWARIRRPSETPTGGDATGSSENPKDLHADVRVMTGTGNESEPRDDAEVPPAEGESGASGTTESRSLSDAVELLDDESKSARREGARSIVGLVRERAVDPEEATGALEAMLTHSDAEIRKTGALLVGELADDFEAIEPLVPELYALIERTDDPGEQLVRFKALPALSRIGRTRPDAVRPALPALADALDDDVLAVRRHAIDAISHLAAADPDSLVDHVEDVAAVLEAENVDSGAFEGDRVKRRQRSLSRRAEQTQAHSEGMTVTLRAAETLADVAEHRPEAVTSVLEDVAAALADAHPKISDPLTRLLGHVAEDDPAAIEPVLPTLGAALRDADETARRRLVRVLAGAAEAHPEEVASAAAPAAPAVLDSMADWDDRARGFAVGVLSYVAESHPEALEGRTAEIVELLDSERAYVRANAAWTLGYLGTESATEALRELRETDPDREIREVAARALEMTESRESGSADDGR